MESMVFFIGVLDCILWKVELTSWIHLGTVSELFMGPKTKKYNLN